MHVVIGKNTFNTGFYCRKENVMRLWKYLLELLRARRMRLEMSLSLQKIFQEMLYILDWMEEIKVCYVTYLASMDILMLYKMNKVTDKT